MALKQVYTPGKRALPTMNSKARNNSNKEIIEDDIENVNTQKTTDVVKAEISKAKKQQRATPKVILTPKTAKGSGSTKSFYVSNTNYDKLKELAEVNNMNLSEVLNEVLSQVL